jgi:hypothetical protein
MMQNESRKPRITLRGLGCFLVPLFLLFVCIGSLFAVGWGNSDFICFGTLLPSNSDVENKAFVKFPESARNIEFHANGVNRKAGCTIWAKFEMQPNDLSALLKTTLVKKLDAAKLGDTFSYLMQQQGWSEGSLGVKGYSETNMEAGVVSTDQWIWVDTSNPSASTIYLIVNKEWL